MFEFNITNVSFLGIGLTTPIYPLDVSGSGRFSNNLIVIGSLGVGTSDLTYSLTVSGDINATGFVKGSSLCIGNDCRSSWPDIPGESGWTDEGNYVRLTTLTDKVIVGGNYEPIQELEVLGDINATGNVYGSLVCSDCVSLGSETTGNYVASLTEGTGIVIGGTPGEGWTPSISIDTNVVPRKSVDESISGNWNFVNGLKVGGGYGSGGLTIDDKGNILTEGNLTYSGYTYVVDVIHVNGTAEFPYGIKGGYIYPGTCNTGDSCLQSNYYFYVSGDRIYSNTEFEASSLYDNGNRVITSVGAGNGLSVSGEAPSISLDVNVNTNKGLQIVSDALEVKTDGNSIVFDASGNLKHGDTSSQASVSNAGGIVIQNVSLDDYGHVTGLDSVNLDNRYLQGSGASGQVGFFSGSKSLSGSNDLYWDNVNKRLGIGTNSPDYTLHVDGDVRIEDTLDVYSDVRVYGSLGIGVSDPSQELHVEGNANITGTLYANNISSYSPLRLQTSGVTRLFIDSDGKVGIGTTSPDYKLEVSGDIYASEYVYGTQGLCIGNDCKNSWSEVGGVSPWDNNTQQIFVREGYPLFVNVSNILFVNGSNGYVGIGTSNPSAQLHIKRGDVGSGPTLLEIESDTYGENKIRLTVADSDKWWSKAAIVLRRARGTIDSLQAVQDGDDIAHFKARAYNGNEWVTVGALWWRVDGSVGTYVPSRLGLTTKGDDGTEHKIVMDSKGNVGIGTESPQAKLHVVGNLTVSNDTVARGIIYWDSENDRLVIKVS